MLEQSLKTIEFDRPEAQGATCGVGHAWAKVPAAPTADERVALKARIRDLLSGQSGVVTGFLDPHPTPYTVQGYRYFGMKRERGNMGLKGTLLGRWLEKYTIR